MTNHIPYHSNVAPRRLDAPAPGVHTCRLKFSVEDTPNAAEITTSGYPFHAVFVNGSLVGSDEFSFQTTCDIAHLLRDGSNVIEVTVIAKETPGWFTLVSHGLPVDLSTRNPDWRWLEEADPTLQGVVACVRGAPENPWGEGRRFHEVTTVADIPAGIVNISSRGSHVMFPPSDTVRGYSSGESVSFEQELVMDFGRETLGYLELEVRSTANCRIILSFAESFNRLDCDYWWHPQDRFQVKPGVNHIHDPSRKGFRYVRISADGASPMELVKVVNHRPGRVMDKRGYFKCSDQFLNQVNEVSCRTVELCAQKFLEDGIKRDRLCWTGDLRPEALVMYNQLGDTDVVRDSLHAFAGHQNERGIIQPAFPWRTGWVMTDYVMWWIVSLWEYYQNTGDVETLRELAPIAFEQEKWLRSKCDERGLMITKSEDDAPITCWSSRSRDGYTSYHNCLWYLTCKCLREVHHLVDRPEDSDSREYAASFQDLLRSTFVDPNGMWRDVDLESRFRPEIPHDGAVTALLAHVTSALVYPVGADGSLQTDSLFAALKSGWTGFGAPTWWDSGEGKPTETRNRIMPFYNAYEAEQRMFLGDWENGVELLRRCYGHMLDAGATTFWEAFQLDGTPDPPGKEGFVSLCHGWSGYPAAFLPGILGWRGGSPEDAELMPFGSYGGLKFAEAEIPVRGEKLYLRSEWDAGRRVWRYSGRLPEVFGSCGLTTGFAPNEVSGIETVRCSVDRETSELFVRINDLEGGEEFEVTVRCAESYHHSQ